MPTRGPLPIAFAGALLLFVGCVFDGFGLGTEGEPAPGSSSDESTSTGDAIDPSTLTPTSTGPGEATGDPGTTTGAACVEGCPPSAGWTVIGEPGEGVGHALVVDALGDVVVAGDRIHAMDATRHNVWLGKFDGDDGALIWEDGHNGEPKGDDYGRGVVIDGDGQIVVAGASQATDAGKLDVWVGWWSGDGVLLAASDLGTPGWDDGPEGADERALALTLGGDGSLMLGGSRCQRPCEAPGAWVGRFTPDGQMLWPQAMVAIGSGSVRGLAALGEELVAVGTDGFAEAPAPWRSRIRRLDVNGGGMWSALPESGQDDHSYEARGVAIDGSGMMWVVGRVFTEQQAAGWIRVYDPAGDVMPLAEAEAPAGAAMTIAVTPGGGAPLIGGSTGTRLWFAQFDPMLGEVWRVEEEGPLTARGIAFDGSGDVIVLGAYPESRVDGERLWLRKYTAYAP